MVRNYLKIWAGMAAIFAAGLVAGTMEPSVASAADITDVLDAADEVYLEDELVSDPFDISLKPTFRQHREWAKLKREHRNTKSSGGDNQTHLYNELEYERTINTFDIDLEIGLFHDLAFRMSMPIVISDQQFYRFDTSSEANKITKRGTCRNEECTEVSGKSYFSPDPTTMEPGDYSFFDLNDGETLNGRKRSGLGDMRFGLAWSPFNTERSYVPDRPWRDETGRSTFTLAFDYVAPTGKTRAIDNANVGRGIHEFIFSVAASHRFSVVDPYIGLQFGLPVGTSAFKDYGYNQQRKDPGMWGKIDLGIEFVPYESLRKDYQRYVKIDLRGYFKYTSEGRNFSELMDAFGQGNYYVEANEPIPAGYDWLKEKWSNAGSNYADLVAGRPVALKEDGIFDYEGYATIGGALSLTIQPLQYLQIRAGVAADYTQDHFITFTKVGKNRVNPNDPENDDGMVDMDSLEERNPTFSKVLDKPGHRIKRTESLHLEWFVGLNLQY